MKDVNVKIGSTYDNKGEKAARRGIKNLGTSLRDSSVQFQKWATIGVAATAAVGVAMVKSQLNSIDVLAKTSDALGIQTKKLQALNHMAELNGVSSEQMAKGLQRMERGLGEALRKGGAAADALEDVGVSVESIIEKSPDQQIQALANAVANVENQALKASIASDLFGRDGTKMLKVLTQLKKDGLEPTVAELERLGFSISRVDAAKVEMANDAMLRTQKAISGIGQKITVKLAPILVGLADKFSEIISQSGGFQNAIGAAFSGAGKAVGIFADGLHGVRIIAMGLEAGFYGFASVINKIFQSASSVIELFINGAINSINILIGAFNKIPGVTEQPLIDMVDQASTYFGNAADMWDGKMTDALASVHEKMMAPLPSEGLKAWAEEAQKIVDEASAGVVQTEQDKTQSVDALEKLSTKKRMTGMSSMFKNMSSLMNVENKKLFNIGKTAAIAGAVVDAYRGITKTMAEYPYPFNIGMAAAHGVAAFAQISNIKKQKFGGGSAASANISSGGAAQARAPQQQAAPQVNRNISVTLVGDSFGGGGVRGLIDEINQELGDGVTLGAA